MSLSTVLKTASSGLLAAQVGLRTTSDNIANINTVGYVRKVLDQQPLAVNGVGMGVNVSGVKRVTDQYLQAASITASSDASRWNAVSQYLDNAQSLFGDPSSANFFFSRLDDIYAAFSQAADDPSSSLLRSQAISDVKDFLSESGRIGDQVDDLAENIDGQIKSDVNRANDLLETINRLNSDISRAKLSRSDSSGSENIQSQLIDELASLMNVQVQPKSEGGVVIRSAEGVALAGDGQAAAKLSYNRTASTKGFIAIEPPDGLGFATPIQITGGGIRGLMDLRDNILPGIQDQLGEFVQRATEQLNAASNKSASIPPPKVMDGRNTGLDLASAIGGFSGQSTIAVLNPQGVEQSRVTIDFTAMTMAPGGAFTPATFATALTTASGGAITANFANGAMTLTASGTNGLAISEGTSAKAGRGFSHFFGLNDIIKSDSMGTYDTGLRPTDNHGFTAGDTISFAINQADGKPLRNLTVTIPAGATMTDLLTALNSTTSGVGAYGQFALDANGGLAFKGVTPPTATLTVSQDTTERGVGGPSMTQLFGIGAKERASRAGSFKINPKIAADPMTMSLGTLDLTVTTGQPAITRGDGRGARLMASAGDVVTTFNPAGELGTVSMTVSRYASEFGGSIGRQAAGAETRQASAEAVSNEAVSRRQSVEGVNMEEELVRLTTYQQAFNASARMVQASKDMLDVLINMV